MNRLFTVIALGMLSALIGCGKQGPEGKAGPQGQVGPQGVKGENGAAGANGEKGVDGKSEDAAKRTSAGQLKATLDAKLDIGLGLVNYSVWNTGKGQLEFRSGDLTYNFLMTNKHENKVTGDSQFALSTELNGKQVYVGRGRSSFMDQFGRARKNPQIVIERLCNDSEVAASHSRSSADKVQVSNSAAQKQQELLDAVLQAEKALTSAQEKVVSAQKALDDTDTADLEAVKAAELVLATATAEQNSAQTALAAAKEKSSGVSTDTIAKANRASADWNQIQRNRETAELSLSKLGESINTCELSVENGLILKIQTVEDVDNVRTQAGKAKVDNLQQSVDEKITAVTAKLQLAIQAADKLESAEKLGTATEGMKTAKMNADAEVVFAQKAQSEATTTRDDAQAELKSLNDTAEARHKAAEEQQQQLEDLLK